MKKKILLSIAIGMMCVHTIMAGSQSPHVGSSPFNSRVARADFSDYPVSDGSDPAIVAAFLQRQIGNLQSKLSGLKVTFSSTSLAAYHYSFYQTYQGIPIYQSEIKVNVSKKNMVYALFDNSYDITGWAVNTTDFDYTSVPAYQSYLRQYFTGKNAVPDAQQMIVYNESMTAPELCYDVMLTARTGGQREVMVGRTGILYQRDALMYCAPPPISDSMVSGMVYRPDPITSGDTIYGGNYVNNNDSDNVKLTAQEIHVNFNADFENDTFRLLSQYIQMTNLANWVNPAISLTPTFNFTRSDSGFEDVMVFYHLNVMRQYLHDLGFTYADTILYADAHGTPADESYFAEPDELFVGMGGVPDGQDCDVFVHEFTHSLSWHANGTNHGSEERAGLDEGTADYDAASYSKSIYTYQWYWVFNWDGHNEFWPGRIVNDSTPYSVVQTFDDRYNYGTCWASALMQIWNATSRNVCDSLVFETLYSYGLNTTLPEGAALILKTDTLLYNGAHTCIIEQAFALRGVLPDDPACNAIGAGIATINANNGLVKFTAYPDGFLVTPLQNDMPLSIDLYDIAGQRLSTYSNTTTEIKPDLPAGIYIINVTAPDSTHQGFKWGHVE